MALNGYIKLHRKLIEWEWYSDMKVSRVFLHLLLTANFKDTNWRGQMVRRGQLIIGKESLGKELGLTIQEVKTVFRKLKKTKEITTKPTNKNTVVTIVNFEAYQDSEGYEQPTTEPTGNQQTTNEQPQRNNEKKDKNKEEEYFDKRIDKNIPFDVVTSSQTLNALFQDKTKAIELVKDTFQIDATEKDVTTAIFSFSTTAVATYDAYRGIRTLEKLVNKFIDWIPKSIKYQSTKIDTPQPETLDLKAYYLQYFREVDLKHAIKDGSFARWSKELEENKFRLGNIAKTYKNKTFTTLLLFELCYMPLGNRLGGSNPQRKLESLIRIYNKFTDYNKNQGDMRQLFDEWRKNQSL